MKKLKDMTFEELVDIASAAVHGALLESGGKGFKQALHNYLDTAIRWSKLQGTNDGSHCRTKVWVIAHPGTGEPVACKSFQEAMSKWFEGFNIPVKFATDESFIASCARVHRYVGLPVDKQDDFKIDDDGFDK